MHGFSISSTSDCRGLLVVVLVVLVERTLRDLPITKSLTLAVYLRRPMTDETLRILRSTQLRRVATHKPTTGTAPSAMPGFQGFSNGLQWLQNLHRLGSNRCPSSWWPLTSDRPLVVLSSRRIELWTRWVLRKEVEGMAWFVLVCSCRARLSAS